jgi:hypothetical protein
MGLSSRGRVALKEETMNHDLPLALFHASNAIALATRAPIYPRRVAHLDAAAARESARASVRVALGGSYFEPSSRLGFDEALLLAAGETDRARRWVFVAGVTAPAPRAPEEIVAEVLAAARRLGIVPEVVR